MKLHSIEVCTHADRGHITSITFILRTVGSEVVVVHSLKTLGLNSGNCKSSKIADTNRVEYMKVTATDYLDSLELKLEDNYYSHWGQTKDSGESKTTEWYFD